jgi:carbamoyltransferase
MNILGLSSGHDANLCVLQNGQLILHVEKERLTRKRYDYGSMEEMLPGLLDNVGLTISQIDLVATSFPVWPYSPRTGVVEAEKYKDEMGCTKGSISICGRKIPAYLIAHHLGHAAYSFFLSPFQQADILTLDAGGNFTCGLFCRGNQASIELVSHLDEQTLGVLWSALSLRLFGSIFAAGKVMGLASYGIPRFSDEIWKTYGVIGKHGRRVICVPVFPDHDSIPSFPGLPDVNKRQPLTQDDYDAAASLQDVTTVMVLNLITEYANTQSKNLVLGGGVALNCLMNEGIRKSRAYERVFVGPAPNDGGLSIGFALHLWHSILDAPRFYQSYTSPYLGRTFSKKSVDSIATAARQMGLQVLEAHSQQQRDEAVVDLLLSQKTIGIHQGRAESGPRALGHRSIIADPRDRRMKDRINQRIKFREPFRPFAPAVLIEDAEALFNFDAESPYMSFAPTVSPYTQETMPAVIHVDRTSRLQTVSPQMTPEFAGIIRLFKEATSVPAILNTSLNTKGQPVCDTPEDSMQVLMNTDLDALVVENILICKAI